MGGETISLNGVTLTRHTWPTKLSSAQPRKPSPTLFSDAIDVMPQSWTF